MSKDVRKLKVVGFEADAIGTTEKIIDEIAKGEHKTIKDAIEEVVEDYEEKIEDYYFMAFSMNGDFDGGDFSRLSKHRIKHKNELELQGKIGKLIDEHTLDESHMVLFLNKRRALKLHERITQWEQLGIVSETIKKELYVLREKDADRFLTIDEERSSEEEEIIFTTVSVPETALIFDNEKGADIYRRSIPTIKSDFEVISLPVVDDKESEEE